MVFKNPYFIFIIDWGALGLSCVMWDLLVVVCGFSFPDQGLNLSPIDWERGVLALELEFVTLSSFGMWALGEWSSVVVARGLSSCGSQA